MITAFVLGLMGSLHCAGMCGPLVLMTPVVGNTRESIVASRLIYHAGRIAVYALIGSLFGVIGESIVFAGFQRWLSITAALLMMTAFFAGARLKSHLARAPIAIKSLFNKFLWRRTYPSIFALGATNGLLPCGLVYIAATASVAGGSVLRSVVFMIFFGLGTLPALLAISVAGKKITFSRIPGIQKAAPVAAILVALLLIVRSEPLRLFRGGSIVGRCPVCTK